jgi:hypothetical protein
MVTIVTEEHTAEAASGRSDGEDLWLSAADAAATTGWTLKPEGLCRGEVCVPVPRGREADFVRDGAVNIAAFWRHMGRPAVHPDDGSIWVLGAGAAERAETLRSLEAPDFALPDLDGRMHTLSEHRGKKVLLVTWASW